MKHLILSIAALSLTACANTQPVSGKVTQTGEAFIGTATSVLSGPSTLSMTFDSGSKCTGQYQAPLVWTETQGASADGTFTCEDGRAGSFSFTGTMQKGQGFGRMTNGQKFTFVYGDTSFVKQH